MVVEASGRLRFGFDLRFARSFTRDAGASPMRVGNRGGGGKLGLYRPDIAQTFSRSLNETRLHDHLPFLRPSIG